MSNTQATAATTEGDDLEWSPPYERNGKHHFFAIPNAHAYKCWQVDRRAMEEAGFSMKKVNDEFELCFTTADPAMKPPALDSFRLPKKLVLSVPKFKIDTSGLLPYQPDSVRMLVESLRRQRYGLDGSETGTGKTYVICAAARELGLRVGVVCPKVQVPVWERVALKLGVKIYFSLGYEKLKTGTTGVGHWNGEKDIDPKLKENLLNMQNGKKLVAKRMKELRATWEWEWTIPDDVLLVFDEAHRCKAVDSLNARMMIAAKKQGIPVVPASATIGDNPAHMRAVGYVLDLHGLTDFDSWACAMGCYYDSWGNLRFDKEPQDLYRLHCSIFPMKGTRLRIDDLGDLFPETQITSELYDMDDATQKIQQVYDDLENQLQMLAEGKSVEKGMNILTVILRARQKVELLKAPAFASIAEDAIEEGMSPAIFVNFTDTLNYLAMRLKTKCLIMGGQSQRTRQENIAAFQADESRVIIANIRAGGTGVSLHDLKGDFRRLALVSPSYSAQDLIQALGRVHRAEGKSKSLQRIIFAAKTIEERICEAVKFKIHCLNTINDGDMNTGFTINPQAFSRLVAA